jgi:mono/diheme cytochrome c family protein
MCSKIHLTRRAIQTFGCALIFSIALTTGCKNQSVTEVAQANPNAPAASPAPNAPQGIPATAPNTSQNPGLPIQPSVAPADARAALLAQAASPAPGATPDPAASPNRSTGGKMITVVGSQGAKDFATPPPTPTPTPAPTPVIEMVNGKIKQQWQAPAEFANLKSPITVTPEVVKRGKYLYTNRCAICHGDEGKGNGGFNKPEYKQSTNLASKVVQANSDGELFYKVSNFRDRHPSSKVIYSDEERWMVVAFLRTLKQ